MTPIWTVPREWPGETAFIIGGGPSVKGWAAGICPKTGEELWPALPGQDLERLQGRRVITVNSSWTAAPFANFLFFADARWWQEYGARTKGFGGRIVTVSKALGDKRLLTLNKIKPPPGLATKPTQVAMQRTSLQGAMNLAFHLGVKRIVLLGADMRAAPDGRTHHHKPHKWKVVKGCWDRQMEQLRACGNALADKNVDVVNCSPVSKIEFWPKARLEDCL